MASRSGKSYLVRRSLQGSRVGDDLIIFDDRVGKYYVTQQVGGDIWDMLVEPVLQEEIYARLLAEYAIDEITCKAQVDGFLQLMLAVDVVEVRDSVD